MPNATPGPTSFASATSSGLVSKIAQSFAGVKTFLSALVASAGIQVATLFNTNGGTSGDKGIVVGFSTADGSVNAAAKPLVVATGIGGTQVDKWWVDKQGDMRSGGTGLGIFRGSSASSGWIAVDDSQGVTARYGNFQVFHNGGSWSLFDHAVLGTVFSVATTGAVGFKGTDSTGTPGAATINRPLGKSSIAIGASSVVITNSLVTTASHIVITPHARDTTCKELIVVAAAGSFTVSGTASATAALPFSWEVKTLT